MSGDDPKQGGVGGRWRLPAAGAVVGIGAAGFLASVLTFVWLPPGPYAGGCEPVAALVGALGVWCFSPGREVREALMGAGAALAAMLLCDVFGLMGRTFVLDWGEIPGMLVRSFHWYNWPRLVRYGFGLYVGWHICYAGRAGAVRPSSAGSAGG